MNRFITFFEERIWNVRLSALSKKSAAVFQFFRILSLTIKFFIRNKCALHASALTYYTSLSIIPVAALLFGIAKGYGFDQFLKSKIREGFATQGETVSQFLRFTENALVTASGGVVAGFGVILLFWTAFKLLTSIETSFNEIWGVHRGRTFFRRLSDYFAMLIFAPLMILILITCSAFVFARLQAVASWMPFTQLWSNAVLIAANLFPFLLACLFFTFIYMCIPNTKVQFKAAATAGCFTGIIYIGLQFIFLYIQKKLTGYNAVYGSFAAIPILLLWLQISWSLILLGAQLAFSIQNVKAYELCPLHYEGTSIHCRALHAIRIMAELADAFRKESGPVSMQTLSEKLEIPIRMARFTMFDLCECGLAVRLLSDEKREELYQLAIPLAHVVPTQILKRLTYNGYNGYQPPIAEPARKLLDQLWSAAEQAEANRMPEDENGGTDHE